MHDCPTRNRRIHSNKIYKFKRHPDSNKRTKGPDKGYHRERSKKKYTLEKEITDIDDFFENIKKVHFFNELSLHKNIELFTNKRKN